MRKQALHNVQGKSLRPVFAETPAQEILHHLALQVAMAVPSPLPLPHNPGETGAEVLLETEIDGVRYLLLRSCPRSLASPFGLSQREAEIARLVAAGYPNKIIAHALDISPWTVCTYLRRIFAKIGVSCRAAMVARLSVEGMVHNGLQPGGAKVAPLPAKTV